MATRTAELEEFDAAGVLARWQALRAAEPKIRLRDAAAKLGLGEAALVAAGADGDARPLAPDWGALLQAAPALGHVMALTRNEACVHERRGTYENVQAGPGHILVLGPDIDLRLFPGRWAFGFAVSGEGPHGPKRSLQIFDASGDAVHKIHAVADTDLIAWDALVARFAADGPARSMRFEPRPAPQTAGPDADIDAAALLEGWRGLQDVHDFQGLLARHKVERQQACRLVGRDYARPLTLDAARRVLQAASDTTLPIMVFVGNRGAIQIHTGPVEKLAAVGAWFNVMDPAFNLHLREDMVAAAWAVRKPTRDGVLHSVELYAEDGSLIATFFGKRKPGQPELEPWRALVEALPSAEYAA